MKTKLLKKSVNARRKVSDRARSKIRTILATTDFSDESLAGVRYAVALAEKLSAAVGLLYVVEPPSRVAEMEGVAFTREDWGVSERAGAQLKQLAERESKNDLNLTSLVRVGIPFHEITTAASERTADLIVIATHGYIGAQHALLGSTAERVVRHAPCPVLTVPAHVSPKRRAKALPLKLTKILVPIDFSNVSEDALPLATFLAGRFGADLILLHVVQKFPIDYLLGRDLMNETITPLIKQAESNLQRMAGSLSKSTKLKISAVVRDGRPFAEICDAAKALGADLIALTTHGWTGLKHVWLGSTTERVVRHAHCPVLAVRELKSKTPR